MDRLVKIIIPGQETVQPERQLIPINLRDGVLICNHCEQPMTPTGEIWKTLVGFYSPPEHDHDDNCLHQLYKCENGHSRNIAKRRRCPKCDWVGKESCFCHDGIKLDEWPKPVPKLEIV